MGQGPDIGPRRRRWQKRPAKARRRRRAAPSRTVASAPAAAHEFDSLDDANLDYRRAKAEAEKFRLAELRGELVRREDLDRLYRARQAEARKVLEGLGQRLAPQLYGREVHEIEMRINDGVREVMLRLSEPVHEAKKAKREVRRRRGA